MVKLKLSGAIPLLQLYVFMVYTTKTLPFYALHYVCVQTETVCPWAHLGRIILLANNALTNINARDRRKQNICV
jgi:hypothetical protein